MHEWIVTTDVGYRPLHPDHVQAEYPKITEDGGFIEFKAADHKTVYIVSSKHVVSIARVVKPNVNRSVSAPDLDWSKPPDPADMSDAKLKSYTAWLEKKVSENG